ncbi:MAG: NAD-dependent epimerase/dehydratase family protein [Enterobacteriaceae bacterium]
MTKRKSTFFVIGATGYIGAPLYQFAREHCHCYGTSSSGKKGLWHLDLTTPADFEYGKIRAGDIIFVTAAISAPDICAQEYAKVWTVNVTGTATFISQAINRGARVIFFSSDTIYGERENAFDESATCYPAGEYAVMKHEIEQRFRGNPSFKAIRLSYVFSREDKFTRYLIGCSQRAEEAALFHPFFRAIVHRGDVISGAMALAEHWHKIPEQFINFGGPQVLSRIEFAQCLRDTHLQDLRFKVTEPDANFFSNRPRVIAMTSPIFARLSGRSPHPLREAIQLEFGSSSDTRTVL